MNLFIDREIFINRKTFPIASFILDEILQFLMNSIWNFFKLVKFYLYYF